MQYAYGYQLNGTQTSGLDLDARAYINAIVSAGATVDRTQRNAINNFYKTGKSQGWYGQLKRMFLPIWGAAAPNAIDLIALTSGTFVGGVTHGNGFAQGNGSSGYFAATSLAAAGATQNSISIHFLINVAETRSSTTVGYVGGFNSSSQLINVESSPTVNNIRFDAYQGSTQQTSSLLRASQTGVLSFVRNGTSVRSSRRNSLGAATLASATIAAGGSVPTATTKFMVGEFSGLYGYTNARFGVFAYGLGLSDAATDAQSSSMKTLWETCTGLTIP
jgi:hypothetical protein